MKKTILTIFMLSISQAYSIGDAERNCRRSGVDFFDGDPNPMQYSIIKRYCGWRHGNGPKPPQGEIDLMMGKDSISKPGIHTMHGDSGASGSSQGFNKYRSRR